MVYIVKAAIFTVFLSLVYFVIDYFLNILKTQIADLGSVSVLMCQFGIWSGLTAFISIVATAFAFKQVLSFLK